MYKRLVVSIAVSGLLVASVAVSSAVAHEGDQSLALKELAPSLQQPMTSKDHIPDKNGLSNMANFVDESSRYLGETDSGIHWVVTDTNGNICLVTRLPDKADGHDFDAEILGASCSTALNFYNNGIDLSVSGSGGHGNSAILLPASISISAEENATALSTLKDADALIETKSGYQTLISFNTAETEKISNEVITLTHNNGSTMNITLMYNPNFG